MSTKWMIIAAGAAFLLGCAQNDGAAGSQTGRVEAPLTALPGPAGSKLAGAAPSIAAMDAQKVPTLAQGPLARTAMPKAAATPATAPTSIAETQPATAAAPVAAAPVAASPLAVDSKYLSPLERLRVVGLAVESACLGLQWSDMEGQAKARARLHEGAGITAEQLHHHLPYFFSESQTAEAVGATRKLCEPQQVRPVAEPLAAADETLLQTLLAATSAGTPPHVDDTIFVQTINRLRTDEAFRKAFVARSLDALAQVEAPTQPGGPSMPQLPQAPNDDPPAEGGCTSDKDCKGDRICVDGQCVTPGGSVTPPPVDPKPTDPVPTDPKPTADTLRFSGRLGSDGSVSFRIKGTSLTAGSATVRGRNFTLKGALKGGTLTLNGSSGGDYIKITGKYKAGTKWVKGSYKGTIAKGRAEGSFSANAN